MDYKLNRYLYVIDKGDMVIVNTLLSNTLFGLSKEKYKLLLDCNFSVLKKSNPALFSAMEKLQVIIPVDFDELDQVKMLNRRTIFNTNSYRLTINPTLECNFNCWYCYENHPIGFMAPSLLKSVVRHIKRKIKDENLKCLNLDWFGGEPLLYFNEVVYPLSKELRRVTNKAKVIQTGSITTNGYLINAERAELFNEIGLNNFQITLDGNQEMHDKIRSYDKKGSFKTIVDNINLLSEYEYNHIMVRINYTRKTLLGINEIIPFFSEKAKAKIVIHFQQVWQDSFKKYISADDNKKMFINNGFNVHKYGLNSKGSVCYADFMNQAVINYDGRVFKCTARDFYTTKEDGVLLNNGEIQWNMPLLAKRMGRSTFENEHCISCNLLPVCMGPCSQKMVEFTSDMDFRRICLKDGVKLTLEQKMNDYYNKLKLQGG